VSAISMNFIPRSTRAQKMDLLSSQANLAGYVAVILATEKLNKIFPMMMTPAGTIRPSRVFVIGAGVAGLQAIATARRLGATVSAFDTRTEVKEQIESLGAKAIQIDLGETGQTKDGYAKALTQEQLEKQKQEISKICQQSDVVITTAQIFGKKAPLIVTQDMISKMKPESIIIDMAVETGGNVEGSQLNKEITINDVLIVGFLNLSTRVPLHASQMVSSNLFNLIDEFWSDDLKSFMLNQEDEIIQGCLLTHQGHFLKE
jgi:H+-translocating NAD(P) transhydrogenase subunit alpha